MADSAARLLALLSLLQSRPSRTGTELADRLGVTTRTVRHDIDRLRELGYPVDATRGATGGYRLGAGGKLPPLLLDDEEAVAVAVGLRAATGIAGIGESSARALAKLQQVLPHRLRSTVAALSSVVDRAPENTDTDAPDPEVDHTVLAEIATAVRDARLLRLHYRGEPHTVEPYRLLSWTRRWHLVARDPASGEWETFRADWIETRPPPGRPFARRPLPGGDYTAFAMRSIAMTGWKVHARLRIAAPAEAVLDRIHAAVGVVESISATESVLVTGADSLETIAAYIGMLGMDFTVESPPELVPHLQHLAEVYLRATSQGTVG